MTNQEKEELMEAHSEAAISYAKLLKEATEMKENMQQLMLKYNQALQLLAKTQRTNSELRKEVSIHQAREAALLGHLKSNLISMLAENSREKIDERLIN